MGYMIRCLLRLVLMDARERKLFQKRAAKATANFLGKYVQISLLIPLHIQPNLYYY